MANAPTGGSPFDFQANPDAVEGVDYIDGYHTIRAFDIMDGQLLNFFKLERALRNLLRCSNYFPCLHAGRVNGLRFSIDTSGNVVVTDSDGTTYTLALTTADHGTLTGLGDDDHIIYIKADGSRAFTGAQAVVETDGTTPGLKTTADATTGIRLDGTNGIISMIIGGTAELIIAEGKITIPGLLDPTGLELSPVAANPGGTPANTLWADSGAGNRFKIGTNTVAYLSEVGTGDMLAANNLSDVGSAATSRSNLGAYGSGDDVSVGDLTTANVHKFGDQVDTISAVGSPYSDYTTPDARMWLVNSSATFNSFAAVADKIFTLVNSSTSTITIKHETGTTAANRVWSPTGADYAIAQYQSATLWYDTTNSRWRIISGTGT